MPCWRKKSEHYPAAFSIMRAGCWRVWLFCCCLPRIFPPALPQLMKNGNAILLMGGVIGVINIILLNRIVTRIPPLQLTLIVFVAQLASGMLLDYFLLDLFSMRKLIGCSIVVIGLLIHTYAQGKPAA